MKLEIKSIGIWSLIKVSVFINAIIGFIFGFFYALFLSFVVSTGMMPMEMAEFSDVSTIGLLVFTPIVFSICAVVFGTIWGVICVIVYNLLAKLIGGLEITTNDISITETTPPLNQNTTTVASTNNSDNRREISEPPPSQSIPESPAKKDDSVDSSINTDENKKDKGPDTNYEI